jgi:hypothetical protein
LEERLLTKLTPLQTRLTAGLDSVRDSTVNSLQTSLREVVSKANASINEAKAELSQKMDEDRRKLIEE